MGRFKYRIGARVKILVGHPIWKIDSYPGAKMEVNDIRVDLVGKYATIKTRTITQGMQKYGLEIDDAGYMAWFGLKQIERL
ncbi:hypothetical protein A2Z67_02390 [Candidatus Woesebacteria bacterium RBG_13_36_22]|uniref:Uncharacterized protein n=1 Tax=Candidatus Woesebacteria bacterium RBG_13_36_22 TaxID=1802478 RepID=A0A1F7X1P9_9BACT|nr:MAG: hypothetical protein A2Z67_02390 [Candidatus Woesebacteria bacterium RBG_13_36_22]